jgi:RND superfamily putative drug exporter
MTITLALSYMIFGLLQHSSLSFIVTTLSAILIMGLSTDYSVYIINRYIRTSQDERVKTTVQWAGHAVFTSSIIVIISYLVMALFNIPLIGDGGYLNALGILITLLVALTLLPSFLHYSHGKSVLKHKFNFSKVASISRNHKYMFTAFLVILLVASLIIYEITPTSFDLLSLIPNNPGKIGYYQIVKSYGFDPFGNNYIILKLPYKILNNGTFNSTDLKIVQSFDWQILQSGYINKIETVDYPFGSYVDLLSLNSSYPSYHIIVNQSYSFIGKSAYYVLMNIYPVSVSFSQNAVNSMSKLDKLVSELSKNYGINYWIGGPSQSLLDSSNFIKASTYTIVEVLSIIIFVVLSYQLSALLTPLRLLLNVGVSTLTSVAAFYIIYNYILHYPIIVFGPLFVIVTLFGVGLDYDIFLITRTREEVFKGKSDEDAIEEALKENAVVIIALGLIISAVFGALIFSPIRIISEIGVSITIGVLFETLISWMFLIPSLMLIMKKYNWWPSKIRGDKT